MTIVILISRQKAEGKSEEKRGERLEVSCAKNR